MRQNISELISFYETRLGRVSVDMACRRLNALWPSMAGCSFLGLGYASPYHIADIAHAKRCVHAMPSGQGACRIVGKRGLQACLVDEGALPFEDATFDRVLLVHALEEADYPNDVLRELWRVTRPEGRIIIIAANRAGVWAGSEKSPFGSGRPFSRKQLRDLLIRSKFQPTLWSGALHVPPVKVLCRPSIALMFERFGETVWPGFSGLIMTEAIKRLYIDPNPEETVSIKRPAEGKLTAGGTSKIPQRDTRRDDIIEDAPHSADNASR